MNLYYIMSGFSSYFKKSDREELEERFDALPSRKQRLKNKIQEEKEEKKLVEKIQKQRGKKIISGQ